MTLDAAGAADVSLLIPSPAHESDEVRGYAVVVTAQASDGMARAATAFDVAHHWSEAPRYGFLSDFSPEQPQERSQEAIDRLLRLHINVVQFYDWMATHHTLLAETDPFVDPLGRRLSQDVVRRRVRLCHDAGIAALGYGAIYGAERDWSEAHPDQLLYDGARRPLHLADLFYLQDFSQGSPWREHILTEYERAIEAMGFDGIHIDQYGMPKRALSHLGGIWQEFDAPREFASFVEDAGARTRKLRAAGGNIFNCVNAWPMEAIAHCGGDAATYIEVWEPHSTYRDLYEIIRRARALRPQRRAILAAYLRAFHPDTPRGPEALNAFRLAFAAIHSSGGSHLIAGEDGLLAEAYYPRHGRLTPSETETVRRYFDFAVRNVQILQSDENDISWTHVGPTNEMIVLEHASLGRYGAGAPEDSLWVVAVARPQLMAVHLINLCGVQSNEWNAPHASPRVLNDVLVRVRVLGEVVGVWWDSPDDGAGVPQEVPFEFDSTDGSLTFRIPRIQFWGSAWWRERC